jgi:tRNA/tmRNA/rRNA uracil-C5-methylase (TrmA/RlmC/RlmD family)
VPAPRDVVALDVERLTFGPDALARHDGQVVFVGPAAPGDRVVADVVERRRGFLRARVRDVLAAGPDRVAPPCAWVDACGGCPWQHVALAAQRAAKTAVVAEQLARLAGLADVRVLPILAAPADLGYRGRVALTVEGRRVGYRGARSHRLVDVDACAVAEPALSAHLAVVRGWVATLRTPPERVELAVAPGGVALVAHARRAPAAADVAATARLLRDVASVRGAVLLGGGARTVVGDPTLHVALEEGLALEVPADAFTQPNPAANRLLVATAMAYAAVAPGARALDLYCGAGNFTLPLARRGAHVLGVERAPVAVAAARANVARLGLADVELAAGDVAAVLRARTPAPVDVVLLDPPRAGAADALAALAAWRPARIVYVSCDPATLARDARTLATHGWRCVRVQPIDCFPHTHHVECVAEFRVDLQGPPL